MKPEHVKDEAKPEDMGDHATLQSVFLHEKQIPAEFDTHGDESDGCSLYRDMADFVVFHKSKGQVPLEDMHSYAPCFVKGSHRTLAHAPSPCECDRLRSQRSALCARALLFPARARCRSVFTGARALPTCSGGASGGHRAHF